mgnify:CR=1 FL=1
MSALRQIALRLPKVELHLHLDGSVSAKFLRKHCARLGVPFPVDVTGLNERQVHSQLCEWIFEMKTNPEKLKPFLPEYTHQTGMMGLFDWMNQVTTDVFEPF